MKRLFLTLYLLIIIGIFGLIVSIDTITGKLLGSSNSVYLKNTYGGIFFLLDQELSTSLDRDTTIKELKNLFGYGVDLITVDEFSASEKETKLLMQQGVIVRKTDKGGFLYAKSLIDTNQVWKIQTARTESHIIHKRIIGPVRLLEKGLRKHPKLEWQKKIKELDDQYPLSISLINIQHIEIQALTEKERGELKEYRIIGRLVNTKHEHFYYRLRNSDQILKIGGTGLPFHLTILLPIGIVIIALFFAFLIYLWIRPLWRNLSELDSAASQFGKGDFSARSKITRFSPIKPLARNFNEMASRIQSLISSHKDLTNAVSHEIRTPLARMRFGLEMLETTDNVKDKQRYAKEMATDIEELDDLVGELLTYAQFERSKPKITLREYNILPWMKDQISRAQKLNKNIPITLHHNTIKLDQTFYFEDRLLARALSNLMRNALQYANSEVHIRIEQTKQDIVINVEDDGDGVPEKFRKTLFDPFVRVDESRSRETGGFGVGLAIVKQIADWHNASLTIEDSQLGGAKFVMQFSQGTQFKQ